jgi:hypothetical protein
MWIVMLRYFFEDRDDLPHLVINHVQIIRP